MRKHVFMAIILTSLIFLYAYSAPAQEIKAPKMVLEEQEFDFKEVKEGEVINHTFKVLNKGDETLKIIKVRPG